MSELVLRSIRDGVIILDAAGNIALINPAACELFGVLRDEALGLNYASAVRLIDKQGSPVDDANNPIAIALNNHQYAETRDLSLITAGSNKSIPVSIIITPTGGPDNFLVITFHNITKELKEEQERSEFISTASHEMRTPVASIEGYLGLAMNPQTSTIDARAATYLEKAHEASQHLGRLFQDLLDTTQLDDGKAKIHLQPVEMTALVKDIADSQQPLIAAKGLHYHFGDAESASGKRLDQLIYAEVDIDYLREIIYNIMDNAIKYTATGSITVNVTADNHNVVITITDTGLGIAREELPHIFQKFYRVDTSNTREIGGTGLGLYITKQRAEAMRGRVWAESELGHGSTFFVSLPRLSTNEYEKRKLAMSNQMMVKSTSI